MPMYMLFIYYMLITNVYSPHLLLPASLACPPVKLASSYVNVTTDIGLKIPLSYSVTIMVVH